MFAGIGGFSEGARQAGASVAWAADSWELAARYHHRNHPETLPARVDLTRVDFAELPPFDLLLASPACQGHTNARGRERDRHGVARSTAWAVVGCARVASPETLVVENVPGFRAWNEYPEWRGALEALGYHLTEQVLDAAEFGVPQSRARLFVVGSKRRPIAIESPGLAPVPASSVIDFASGSWSQVDKPGRAAATLARIAAGRREFGTSTPFLAPFYGSGSGLMGRSLDRPLGTVTTRDRWSLIDGDRMRMLTPSEYRAAMGFWSDYRIPAVRSQAIHLLGNAVCPPVAKSIVEQVTA